MPVLLETVYAKLRAGQNSVINSIGDSTVNGVGCPAKQGGWNYVLGQQIGIDLNVNVRVYVYSGGWVQGPKFDAATNPATKPWLYMYDAGILSAKISNQITAWGNATKPVRADADAVIVGEGVNDLRNGQSISAYISDYHNFVDNYIRNNIPTGTPVILTTENPVNESANPSYSNIAAGFSALASTLTSGPLPLTDGLATVTSWTNVSLMDTRQAYANTWQSALWNDDIHPNCDGYNAQGLWMFNKFKNPPVVVIPEPPTIISTSLPDMTVGVPITPITLTATGSPTITWTTAPGSTLPAGLSLSSSGVLSGTPTAGGTPTFTIRASNSVNHDDQPFTVNIGTIVLPPRFIPDNTTVWKHKIGGRWMPLPMNVKQSGSMRRIPFHN